MERAAVFIDAGYLNKVLKNYFGEPPIDYLKLSEQICKDLGLIRLRTYFYQCMPIIREVKEENYSQSEEGQRRYQEDKLQFEEDKKRYAAMQRFITKLRRLPRFEVKLGKLQIIGGEFNQKMIDVLMSIDIVEKCLAKQIQHGILIAGDSDFVPAIKKAKDYGAIIHLYYHQTAVHDELLDEIDELHPLTQTFINKVLREHRTV
jgi:uncharacterized LabA/DUF88 family protein